MIYIEELKAARDYLSDPSHWFKGDLKNVDGTKVCALGACDLKGMGVIEANRLLGKHLPGGAEAWQSISLLSVAQFNDDPNTTHQDVLNLFDKALADLGGLG